MARCLRQCDRHLDRLGLDPSPDMQLLLEDELLCDDEHLFEHRHDRRHRPRSGSRGRVDHLVDGHAGDLDSVTLQVGFRELFEGVGDGPHPDLACDDSRFSTVAVSSTSGRISSASVQASLLSASSTTEPYRSLDAVHLVVRSGCPSVLLG